MPIVAEPCCCGEPPDEKFCYGCYPNLKVSPITVKLEKKNRYPAYKRPCIKPLTFDNFFSSRPNFPAGPVCPPCKRCAKLVREKEIQLLRKDQELAQLQRHLRKHGGRKHDYGAMRELEFRLLKREHELAKLNMEAIRQGTTKIYQDPAESLNCSPCAAYIRKKENDLIKKEQEIVRQMASPYIKISPNPCNCCSSANQPHVDKKCRKKKQRNCFKELDKKEKKLLKKEREIDEKIQKFRDENIKEAKDDMKKTPDSFIKDVYLNCKCACERTVGKNKTYDPCSYNPFMKAGTYGCTMPFPMWNGSLTPNMHNCTTKCCVMKLLQSLATCYFCPMTCKKRKPQDTCLILKLLRWWAFRKVNRKCF